MLAQQADYHDRKELWYMLDKLDAQARLEFAKWCCGQCKIGDFRVRLTRFDGTADDGYWVLMMLAAEWDFDLDVAAVKLIDMLRE